MSTDRCRFRNQWAQKLLDINRFIPDDQSSNESNEDIDCQTMLNMIKDYLILTRLAHREIDLDEVETNKGLAKANVGLDCADMVGETLYIYACRVLSQRDFNAIRESCLALAPLLMTNQANESMLSTYHDMT